MANTNLTPDQMVRLLRLCPSKDACAECPYKEGEDHWCYTRLRHDAADMIEDQDERISIMSEMEGAENDA